MSKGLAGSVATSVALPGSGADVVIGLRPQHLRLDMAGNTHKVELTEALGGTSFVHLTAPTGEKLVIEAHDDLTTKPGTKVGVSFDAENAMLFAADAAGLRIR